MSNGLLEKETLDSSEIDEIMTGGKSPYRKG
jgi:ATP-dependent Zn protease